MKRTISPRCIGMLKMIPAACLALGLAGTAYSPAAAQEGTLFVEGSRVGIGTATPGGNLHIFGGERADVFNAVGPNATNNAFNFGYSGGTFGLASGFFNVRPNGSAVAPNPALYFATGNSLRMIIDNEGFLGVHLSSKFNPLHPVHAQGSGAHLSAGGVWTNASSRELKENIRILALPEALRALKDLEPVSYNYKVDRNDPQVGFIAEDVPDLVATPDRKTLAPGEIVAVLTRVVQEQQKVIEALSQEVQQLRRNSPQHAEAGP